MITEKNSEKLNKIMRRGEFMEAEYLPAVLEILENVKNNGDKALIEYTSRFDRFEITPESMLIKPEEIEKAVDSVPKELYKALKQAAARIYAFHEKQLEKSWHYEDDGILLGQKITPIDRVGVYVPGGKAAYPSSVLMNVMPAKVAGVKEIIIATPTPLGVYNPAVLAAAAVAGVDKIYRIGGAQAIAAMAYGTDTIKPVHKIAGPGNIYVALAKKMVFGTVDIDMIAGPSEILVIADDSANPDWVAADMLSQMEHDELASAVAVVIGENMAKLIEQAVFSRLQSLKRKDIAEKSLKNYSAIIVADSIEEACGISNDIAPEHLELCVNSPMDAMRLIKHAGAIFMGNYTPEAAGDYFAGPSHVLPTGGSARFFSPLGVYDFTKRSSLIYYNKQKLQEHAQGICTIAGAESLDGHARSVEIRSGNK